MKKKPVKKRAKKSVVKQELLDKTIQRGKEAQVEQKNSRRLHFKLGLDKDLV